MTQDRYRPVTPDYLERAALHYLERFASSSENLKRVLTRKARRRMEPGSMENSALLAMVDGAVERVVQAGLVDDARYAEMKVNALMRRGTSRRTMQANIRAKGVAVDAIAAAFEAHAPDDHALARRYAERKRLGPWRRGDPAAFRDRDMAALGRAGFSYRVARAVLESTTEGEE